MRCRLQMVYGSTTTFTPFFHNQLQSGYHHILKIVHNIYTAYEQKYLMVETCSSDVLYLCECIVLVFR